MNKISKAFADVLNEAFKADPSAIYALQANTVPCNEKLADHPEIIVTNTPLLGKQKFSFGMLGLINGVLARLGEPAVCSIWDEAPAKIAKHDFRSQYVLTGFKVYEPVKDKELVSGNIPS